VLASFQRAYEKRQLDDAYVYGMRYGVFCLQAIPTHDYYRQPRYAKRRVDMQVMVETVVAQLERIAEWMDAEEVEKERQRQVILKQQLAERQRKQQLEEQRRIDEFQRRMQKQQTPSATSTISALEQSALAKLQRLSGDSNSGVQINGQQQQQQRPEPEGRLPIASSYRLPVGGSNDSEELPPALLPPTDDEDFPVPIPPPTSNGNDPAAPPSYNQALEVRQSSYFGPGGSEGAPRSASSLSSSGSSRRKVTPEPNAPEEPPLPSYDQVIKKKRPAPKRIPVRKLKELTARDYVNYQHKGKIQVSQLGTYQGRYRDSTNGCTVISALVVAKHLRPASSGVTDQEVNNVIDQEAGPLLRAIRNKLHLSDGSLIIPSDVHDHLVDSNILFQHKFVGAAGGNILDHEHFDEVCNLLEGTAEAKTRHLKAGATLFFHEHVVGIVKFPTSPTTAVYDLVDSLPGSGGLTSSGRGSRTRCQDIDALRVLLQWYACQKFSDSNCTYIDRHPNWDDAMADFDPRVFQAFVWSDLPKPRKEQPKQ
jgi:hypothetical protein